MLNGLGEVLLKKKLWKWVSIVLVVAVVAIANIYFVKANEEEKLSVKTIKLEEVKLNNKVIATGEVNFENQRKVYYNPAKGEKISLSVEQGDDISKGEKLFQYDDPSISSQKEQLTLENKKILIYLEKYNHNIDQLKEEIKEEKNDEANDEVIEQLEENQQDIEYERRIYNIDYSINKKKIEELSRKEESLTVVSPIDGQISTIKQEALDEQVASPYIIISTTYAKQIETEISEYDINQLKEGQLVTIKPKSSSNDDYKGEIIEINKKPLSKDNYMEEDNIAYFPVKISIPEEKIFKQGVHADLEIEIQNENTSPAILGTALFREDKEEYVIIKKEDKLTKQKVETGTRNVKYVEIVNGIDKGDSIVANPTKELIEEVK